MLSLRNGAFEYGRQRLAFPDINIKPGETVGLYGPSGCGKSTLAQVLAGLVPHSHGVLSHPMKQTGVGSPVQWISQSPEFAFNPRWRLSRSLAESHNVTGQMLAADIQQRHLGALVISHRYPLFNNVCDRVIEWPDDKIQTVNGVF